MNKFCSNGIRDTKFSTMSILLRQLDFKNFKNEIKELVLTSIPLVIGCLSQVFFPIISTIFCGHLGQTELDGVSLANSLIYVLVLSSSEGLTTACDTLFPQLNGGKNKKKIGVLMQKAILISIMTMFGNAALLISSKKLMYLIVDEIEVAEVADQYILAFLPTIIFYNLSAILSKYIQSQNIVYPIMYINFIAILINAALHALFIYGFSMGVRGAALAVDFASFLLVIFLIVYIYVKKIYLHSWPGWCVECLLDWKIYLRLAIPGLFSILIEWSNFEIGNLAASSLPKIELSMMAISQQILFIFFQIPFGISIAANIRIGNFLGSNRPDLAKNSSKITYVVTASAIAVLSVLILSLSNILPYAFSSDPQVVDKTSNLLKFIAFVHILDGFQGTNSGILRACGYQLYTTIFLLIGFYFVGSPIGLTLMLTTSLKVYGFFIGISFGCVVLIILQFIFIFRVNWNELAKKAVEFSSDNENSGIEADLSENDNNKMVSFEVEINKREPVLIIKIIQRLMLLGIFIILFILSILLHESE